MEIIAYGTPEFEVFVKTAPISLDKAWEIQLDFVEKQQENNDFYFNIYKSNVLLFLIFDKYYIFTMKHMNNKTLEGDYLSGIWVDSQTGEVFEKNVDKKIKAQFGWRKQDN